MKDRLLDASALLNFMLSKDDTLESLKACSILDLTVYEVGNAVWRLARVQKKITERQACDLLEYFTLIRRGLLVRRIDDIEYAKRISMESGLTFYDASYIAAAKSNSLVLVTDDRLLGRQASGQGCTVLRSSDL